MIYLEVNGQIFEGFKSVSAERSYSAAPASFSFSATTSAENVTAFPINEGDACRVLIGDQAFITGFVDGIDVTHDDNEHSIAVSGSSLVSDLIDSTMDDQYEIKGPIPLKTALEKIIAMAGVKNISVIDDTGGVEDFEENEVLSGEIGEPVWSLMIKLAIKKQVLLTENGDGNVVITRGEGQKISDVLFKHPNHRDNNILRSNCKRSRKERFNTYKVFSQDDSVSLESIDINNFDAVASSNKFGDAKDDVIRASRVMCIVSEKASQPEECKQRAIWQANFSRVSAFAYACRRQGFVNDAGNAIEPGMMPHVDDAYMSVNADLIIDTVRFSYDESSGSIALLDLLLPDSFTLAATEPTFEDSGNDLGGIFNV